MDKEYIIARLTELIDPTSTMYKEAVERTAKRLRSDIKWVAEELAENLAPTLSEQPEFRSMPNRMMSRGSGASRFTEEEAARVLVYEALGGRSPRSILDDLEYVLSLNDADADHVFALCGAQPSETVTLENGISFMPFSAIPSSREKNSLQANAQLSPMTPLSLHEVPDSGLVKTFKIDPLFYDPQQKDHSFDAFQSEWKEFSDVSLALTAVGPSAPVPAISWISYRDERIEKFASGTGFQVPFLEILRKPFERAVTLTPRETMEVVPLILRLRGKDRDRMNVALSRLNRAIRRHSHEDRALDLAIALESLLVDGAGENTYRVSLRAALLYPGGLAKKLRARAVTKAVYGVRSSVAHSGRAEAKIKVDGIKEGTNDVVNEGIQVCGEIIRQIAIRGAIPKWQTFEISNDAL